MLILCTLLFVHVHSMIIFPKMKPPSHIHFSARECVYGNVNTLIKAHTRPGGTHFLCAKKWARNKILNRYHKMSDIQSFNFHRLFFKLTGLWKVDGYVIVPLSLSQGNLTRRKKCFSESHFTKLLPSWFDSWGNLDYFFYIVPFIFISRKYVMMLPSQNLNLFARCYVLKNPHPWLVKIV